MNSYEKFTKIYDNLPSKKIIDSLNDSFITKYLNSPTYKIIENLNKIEKQTAQYISNPIFEQLKPIIEFQNSFLSAYNKVRENPEIQFSIIIDSKEIDLDNLVDKEDLIENKLVGYLIEYDLFEMWKGLDFALNSDIKENPERSRHFLVSLRTIFEYSLEKIFAPDEKVKESKIFKQEWEKHLNEYPKSTKIPKKIRLKYLTENIDFGFIEFANREIQFINKLYRETCSLHSKDIKLSTDNLRILRIHIGITLWLLFVIYDLKKD